MQDFRRLKVWEKAHRLSADLHRLVDGLGPIRVPGLRSQLLRAASSIATNIAEGCGAESRAEFVRYLDIALKSVKELEYHLIRLHDADYIDESCYEGYAARLAEVRRMLYAFALTVRRKAGQVR